MLAASFSWFPVPSFPSFSVRVLWIPPLLFRRPFGQPSPRRFDITFVIMAPHAPFRSAPWSACEGKKAASTLGRTGEVILAHLSSPTPWLLYVSLPEPGVWPSPFDLPPFQSGRLRSFGGCAAELLNAHFSPSVQVRKSSSTGKGCSPITMSFLLLTGVSPAFLEDFCSEDQPARARTSGYCRW